METKMHFCQSCGMPLTPDVLGTNADGSKSEDYCIYCYKDGAFTGDFTMAEMAEYCSINLPHADHPQKKQFIAEVNALGIPNLHIDNLYVLQGAFVNQTYHIEGNEVKLLDDSASYWGTQVVKDDGRCYGIACSDRYILVSEYGPDGSNPELVMLKRR